MAARKTPPVPPRPPSLSPQEAIRLLSERIEKAQELLANQSLRDSDLNVWSNTTRNVLERSFGSDSPNVDAVIHAHSDLTPFSGMSDEEYDEYLRSKLGNQIKMLRSCIEQLQIDIRTSPVVGTPVPRVQKVMPGRRVFLVHGHDQGTKETVARLLGKLELDPVILHEQPNQGRTLIEKFEDYVDVGFAVVILTADDLGRAKHEAADRPRARQNVILELGFFLGKLGRQKVCALYEHGVGLPSDLAGIVYIPLEGEGWRLQLVRELQAAGFAVDANRIL